MIGTVALLLALLFLTTPAWFDAMNSSWLEQVSLSTRQAWAEEPGSPTIAGPAVFPDVTGHPGEAEISDLATRGILSTPAGAPFNPDDPVTGDFLVWLGRAMGVTPAVTESLGVAGVPPTAAAYYAYLDVLLKAILLPESFFSGVYTKGQVDSKAPLTIAQGLALIVRGKGWQPNPITATSPFNDVQASHWAYSEIISARQHSLFFNDTVYPESPLLRWQAAVYLDRALSQPAQKRIYVSLAAYDWSLYMVEGTFIRGTIPTLTGSAGMETPTGEYTVLSRSDATTMSGADYSVPNVRWCLFFIGRTYAIHGNYWKPHSYFGQDPSQSGSHGCVGLIQPTEDDRSMPGEEGRDDAKVVYDWTPLGTPITITATLLRDHFH